MATPTWSVRRQLGQRRGRTALVVLAIVVAVAGGLAIGRAVADSSITNGSTVNNAAQAISPFTAGTPFDSGQPIDVVVPANSVFAPDAHIFILECAAPDGVDPVTINSCDGNTGYGGGSVFAQNDGSIDVVADRFGSAAPYPGSGQPYVVYALPDTVTFGESPSGQPRCGLGVSNECVLYIGEGGGSDIGLSQPHVFSQPFQVHPDPTDSGTLDPGDGSPEPTTAVSSSLSTVTPASQTVTADGVDHAVVTVTLNDANGVGVAGKTVTLNPEAGHATVTANDPASDVTDENGQAVFSVFDTTAETVTLAAADATDDIPVTATATATFATPTVDQSSSSVTASPTAVPADGTTASTVTVVLRDHSVNASPAPLAGRTVQLVAQNGSANITPSAPGSNVTDATGSATFAVTDTATELVTFTAVDTTDSVTLTDTATVTFGTLGVSPTASTVTAASQAVTGSSGTLVTVTLIATDGHSPVAGKTVTIAVSSPSGHGAVSGPDTVVTNSDGQALFSVSDTTAETVTVTASDTTDDLTLSASARITFAAPTLSASLSTLSVSNSPAAADGLAQVAVTVTVRNSADSPVSGVAVTVTSSDANAPALPLPVASGTPGTTDSSGVAQFGVRDTIAETITLTASAGGVTLDQTGSATFLAGPPDANASKVSASPDQVAADGSTAATVTVTLTDYFGNPVAGKNISLAGTGGSVITPVQTTSGVLPGVTDSNGEAAFKVTDTANEVVTYTATDTTDDLPLSQLAAVTFGTPPPVVPTVADSALVSSTGKVPADGSTAAVVTLELRDADGQPVTGKDVTLTASSGTAVVRAASAGTTTTSRTSTTSTTVGEAERHDTAGGPTVVTDSNGNASFDVTDTAAETVTLTAVDTTDSVTGWTVSVTFTPATTTTTAPLVTATGSTGEGAASTSTGTSGSGSSTGSGPGLAFTGAPAAVPWLVGVGLLLLAAGGLGRRLLATRRPRP